MFEVAEYIGIIAFAISGFFVAVRSRLDFLGVLISVFLTAFGGGIIRDVMVDRTPYAFSSNLPAVMIIAVMVLMIFFRFHKRGTIENRLLFIISDSIGLISFSITGALIALETHFNLTGVLVLSFITAVGGGITRDVIINEVPFVFKTGFYGTISLLIGLFMYLFSYLELLNFYMISTLFITGVALRMVAYYQKWSIPLK
ncbi:MAG TPA: trimeric intracellular cation channel family protein [Sulfurovum sp.]|nr:trimeric intracellular cation channel family protein [Sulfurovum sp.]